MQQYYWTQGSHCNPRTGDRRWIQGSLWVPNKHIGCTIDLHADKIHTSENDNNIEELTADAIRA